MTDLANFLGLYFLGAIIYWLSYIFLRPRISVSNKHTILFLVHLALGLFLVTVMPIYLYLTGSIKHSVVLFLAMTMGLSGLLHHLGILKDIQPWKGFITPKGLKVPLMHGAVSHLLFAISYTIYGVLILYYFLLKTNYFSEKLILYSFFFWIELIAIIVLFDGIRMCCYKKYDKRRCVEDFE